MKRISAFFFAALLLAKFSSAQNINLDSMFNAAMLDTHTPGVSALILKKGIPVWQHNYGLANIEDGTPVTENTSFMLASISKTFISVAIMKLVEQGSIDLNSPIGNYLSFDCHNPNYPDSSITVRELLTHTAAIKDNWNLLLSLYVFGQDSPIPLADFMFDYFDNSGIYYSAAQNFYNVSPGSHYFYSNEGAALAAYLVESTSGISFADYCNQNIFTPLCMDNTSWFISQLDTSNVAMPYHYSGGNGYVPIGYYSYPDYPDGQLRTSVMSLAKFLAMMMNHGKLNNIQILDSATVAEIFTPQIPAIDTTQGIIWYQLDIGGRHCWGHNGGDAGVSTNMYFSPADSTGIISLSNGSNFYPVDVIQSMFDYAESLEPAPNDSFGCSIPTNISVDVPANDGWKIFPNPTSSFITLQGGGENEIEVTLSDVTGKILLLKKLGSDRTIDLSSFEEGVYFLKVDEANEKRVMKLVKL